MLQRQKKLHNLQKKQKTLTHSVIFIFNIFRSSEKTTFFSKIKSMLSKDNFFKIGKIKKKVGKNEEYLIGITTSVDVFDILENTLFLDINACDLLPIFAESYSEQASNVIKVKFDSPLSLDSSTYINKDVYISKELIENMDLSISDMDLIGWKINDVKLGYIGKVVDTITSSQQIVLIINHYIDNEVEEIMIPLHDDLIEESDVENKVIVFSLPEGLLNLNK